jgi:hypothetical protein
VIAPSLGRNTTCHDISTAFGADRSTETRPVARPDTANDEISPLLTLHTLAWHVSYWLMVCTPIVCAADGTLRSSLEYGRSTRLSVELHRRCRTTTATARASYSFHDFKFTPALAQASHSCCRLQTSGWQHLQQACQGSARAVMLLAGAGRYMLRSNVLLQ